MKNMQKAFTMIELVFVIVILGILSAVAVPRLSSYINDANTAKAISTISSIRSSIASERQKGLIKGNVQYPQLLDDATKDLVGESLFDGNGTVSILQYPVYSKNSSGGWMKTTNNNGTTIKYDYYLTNTKTVEFTYNKGTGTFDCDHTTADCKSILQ